MVVGCSIRITFHILIPKRGISFFFFYAVKLDPQFKFEYVKWVIERMYPRNLNHADKVREGIYALFEEYKKLINSLGSHGCTLTLPSSSSITSISCSSDLTQDADVPFQLTNFIWLESSLKVPQMSKWWQLLFLCVPFFFFSFF
ncbi:hypothetical protein M9H77_07357 [Catharanthus roseus]|uniref:Uncharacterized protein n=1 Tax=Catharanthus roseus TaxID=4058 RepID=A0ACC0BUZ4_CATRO|nr:hypothetical protein M9H77_07357 [Catharanthus roseus]